MITKEEKMVFHYELNKLNHEYRSCRDDHLKSQIQDDISFLYMVLESSSEKEAEMEMS